MQARSKWTAAAVIAAWVGSGIVALAEEPTEPVVSKFDMSKGGPTWSHGNNTLTFGMFAQARLTAEDKEQFDLDAAGTDGFGLEDGTALGFKVPRIRLSLRGTLLQPWLKYNVSYELSDTSGERDAKFKDAFVEFAKAPMATVRFGQFKVPFSLEELAPDQNQMFLERAITNLFAVGRDQGVALLGTSANKHFGYAAGAFNGSGESRSQDDSGLLYNGRVWWQPFAEYTLNEGAFDAPATSALHLGAAYRTGEAARGFTTGGAFEDPNNQDAWNVEVAWKRTHWWAEAEYFQQTTENKNPVATAGPDIEADGWHVQGSYLNTARTMEFGLRYAVVDSDTNAATGTATESRGVFNYYWMAQRLKLQFDLGTLDFEAGAPGRNVSGATLATGVRLVPGDVTDTVARLQVQFNF